MTAELGRLSALVIGVSGTGSIVGEQLARLGLGRVPVVDFDRLDVKNLNRILNPRSADAAATRPKAEPFAHAGTGIRGQGVAVPVPARSEERRAGQAVVSTG